MKPWKLHQELESRYLEEVDQALLLVWLQLSSHANIKQDQLGGSVEAKVVCDATPQAVRVRHPDQDVARM